MKWSFEFESSWTFVAFVIGCYVAFCTNFCEWLVSILKGS